MSENKLNARQRRILELLREMPSRDLYEGAAQGDATRGSGLYCVTYGPNDRYEYLPTAEVQQMVGLGLLEQLYPGCYTLAGEVRYDRKGNVIARKKGDQ
jgi:hypothetical protein